MKRICRQGWRKAQFDMPTPSSKHLSHVAFPSSVYFSHSSEKRAERLNTFRDGPCSRQHNANEGSKICHPSIEACLLSRPRGDLLDPLFAVPARSYACISSAFQSQNRTVPNRIFDPLPDSARQGEHGEATRSHRSFLSRDRSTKSFGSPIDLRFGPIRLDWAERSGFQSMEDERQRRQESGSSAGPSPSASGSQGKPQRRKHVFHAKQPQVSLPVARFDKTDSFEGDASGSKDADKRLASCTERFDGMIIGATEVAFGIVHLFRDKQEAASTSQPRRLSAKDYPVMRRHPLHTRVSRTRYPRKTLVL